MDARSSQQRASALQQYFTLLRQALRDQISEPTRTLSPILFGIVFAVVFDFAFGIVPAEWSMRFFAAELTVIILLATQMSLVQSLDTERVDMIFSVLRSYPIRSVMWYWAKVKALAIMTTIIALPLFLATTIISGVELSLIFNGTVILALVLAMTGLTTLGVILATITMQAQGRQVLYALLFFPLSAPILIALSQALLCGLNASQDAAMLTSWLGILAGFVVIYGAIGSVLFAELIYAD